MKLATVPGVFQAPQRQLAARATGGRARAPGRRGAGPVHRQRRALIVANPPYLPGADGRPQGAARAWDGGPDGRRFIDRLCAEAPARLRPGGSLLMIHSSVCGEQQTLERLNRVGLSPAVVERRRGPLGPLLADRAPELREEELLVFEARKP